MIYERRKLYFSVLHLGCRLMSISNTASESLRLVNHFIFPRTSASKKVTPTYIFVSPCSTPMRAHMMTCTECHSNPGQCTSIKILMGISIDLFVASEATTARISVALAQSQGHAQQISCSQNIISQPWRTCLDDTPR